MRMGIGYDVHRLVEGRPLFLGGIEIPHGKGLLGHSDGDVLLHAICDAMLGAAALGDIGEHFPDSEPAYKNIRSRLLLEKTNEWIQKESFAVVNIDATIFAQEPRLGDLKKDMNREIAQILQLEIGRVNIKATTTEGLGIIGSGDAISALSVVSIETTGMRNNL